MISLSQVRHFTKDKIFVVLFISALFAFASAMLNRHSSIERTPIPFNLGLTFSLVNMLFAVLTLRREPLLAYMFLTAAILLNGTLYFYFRYLFSIQAG
jgi:hypothetical protein